jgi:hypothetical protein
MSNLLYQIVALIFSIVVCLGAGGLGAIATTPEIDGWEKAIELRIIVQGLKI